MSRTVPALPVSDMDAAVEHYIERFGFECPHRDGGFAVVVRDDARLHLWESSDQSWREREDLRERVVHSGAESFIAGTASCRIEVTGIDALFAEYEAAGVLYEQMLGRPGQPAGVALEPWGVRDFHCLDQDCNLVTFYAVVPDAG